MKNSAKGTTSARRLPTELLLYLCYDTRLDAGVASLKRIQAALKRYRASVLKAACEGRLVLREAELAREEVRPLPEGWTWASPSQLATGEDYALAIGPFGSNLKVSDDTSSGVPLAFVRNIRSRSFSGEKAIYISEENPRNFVSTG